MVTFLQIAADTIINPQDFFTKGSFATLLGATGIVYLVTGVVQNVFNFKPKWFALALSIVVSLIAASINTNSAKETAAIRYLIILLNGFLIYSSASGSNQIFNHGQTPPTPPLTPKPAGSTTTQKPKRLFNSNWWK